MGDGSEGSAFSLFDGCETFRQILPSGIILLNQSVLLFAAPTLDLFFASDRVTKIRKRFAMDQPENLVSGCEPGCKSAPMLNHPALEVVGYAYIQVSRPAGKDVNPIRAAHFAIRVSNSRSLTAVRQRQATGFGMTANPKCAGPAATPHLFQLPLSRIIVPLLRLSSTTCQPGPGPVLLLSSSEC